MLRDRPRAKWIQIAPTRGERDGEEDDEGMDEGFELGGHDHVDEEDGQDQGELQVLERFPAEDLLARDGHRIIRGQGDLGHLVPDPGHDPVEGGRARDLGPDFGDPRLVVADDLAGRFRPRQAGDVRERDPPAPRFEHEALELAHRELRALEHDLQILAVLLHLSQVGPGQKPLDLVPDRVRAERVAGGGLLVDLDVDLGAAGLEARDDVVQVGQGQRAFP